MIRDSAEAIRAAAKVLLDAVRSGDLILRYWDGAIEIHDVVPVEYAESGGVLRCANADALEMRLTRPAAVATLPCLHPVAARDPALARCGACGMGFAEMMASPPTPSPSESPFYGIERGVAPEPIYETFTATPAQIRASRVDWRDFVKAADTASPEALTVAGFRVVAREGVPDGIAVVCGNDVDVSRATWAALDAEATARRAAKRRNFDRLGAAMKAHGFNATIGLVADHDGIWLESEPRERIMDLDAAIAALKEARGLNPAPKPVCRRCGSETVHYDPRLCITPKTPEREPERPARLVEAKGAMRCFP